MIWVRKAFVHLLSLLLFIALFGGVLATSFNIALAHPAKLETWLNQSNLYGHFVSTAIQQGQKSTDNGAGSSDSSNITLSDIAVQQAAETAFSPVLLQQDVNTFLDSNYAWLEGKTAKPDFVIDLTSAKQNFGKLVGQAVQTYLTNIPVCTAAQTATLQTSDPLSLPCRPASLNPVAAGANAQQKIVSNDGFLSNPVITANNISPSSGKGQPSQPYYQKLSVAPKAYQAVTKLPLALGGLALLCVLGIVFIAPRKRKGLRRVGIVFIEVGILLIAIKFIADTVFKRFEGKLFNNASIGQLQQALTDFAHRVESQIVNVNFYFGITLAALALIIFIVLIATRNRAPKSAKTPKPTPDQDTPQESPPTTGAGQARKPVLGMTTPAKKPATSIRVTDHSSTSPKRPRLVQ